MLSQRRPISVNFVFSFSHLISFLLLLLSLFILPSTLPGGNALGILFF